MNEEFIDIRQVFRLLFKQWKWIFAAALFPALATVGFILSLPERYEAEATVVILQSRTEVRFDPRIETLSDYELTGNDRNTRRDGLIALVKSNQVVQQVLADVGNQLDPEERDRESLRGMVETEIAGDLINIGIHYADPETAALIANSWIQHYEQHVNEIYGTNSNFAESNTSAQVEAANERYEDAQRAVEAFMAEDVLLELQQEVEARNTLLDGYQQTLVDIQVNPVSKNQALMRSYYAELQEIETALADAEALREQVNADSDSTAGNLGNTLALVLLRSRIYGGQRSNPWTYGNSGDALAGANPAVGTGSNSTILQIDVGSLPEGGASTEDVEALITVLEMRQVAAQERIESLVTAINSGETAPSSTIVETDLGRRISALEDEITDLESEIEAQSARRRELQQVRDQAWETYQVLSGKQIEEQIASESPSAEVRIADVAVPPVEPSPRGLLMNTILVAAAGAFIAVFLILVSAWWTGGVMRFQVEDDAPSSSLPRGPEEKRARKTRPVPESLS